jgi:hypothetical protein
MAGKKKKKKVDPLASFLDGEEPVDLPWHSDPVALEIAGFLTGDDTEEIKAKTTGRVKRVIGRGGAMLTDIRADMSNGMDQGKLIQEVVAMRPIIPERYTDEDWARILHSVGHVPFYILCEDVDRYHLAMYAAEQLRDPSKKAIKDAGLKYLPRTSGTGHDPNEYQEKIHGKRWGGVDPEETKPVREQMTEKQKKLIESKRAESVASIINSDKYDLPIKERWANAEKVARIGKREDWEGLGSPEFESMVQFCYRWIKDCGRVPRQMCDPMDVYWERWGLVKGVDEKTNERRMSMVKAVRKFWRKAVKEARAQGKALDLKSQSYRTVLGAMKLQRAIEEYAWNHKVWKVSEDKSKPVEMELVTPDEVLVKRVEKAAKGYFKAHFPLKNPPPGPMSTVDPDYHTYMRLCRKYGLKQGALLHKNFPLN